MTKQIGAPAVVALFALFALFPLFFGLLGATRATPDTSIVSCAGHQSATYAPALGPTSRSTEVSVTEAPASCVGASFTAGLAAAQFVQQASCLVPAPAGTIVTTNVVTCAWSYGTASTITFPTTVVRTGGQTFLTPTGTVTAGLALGAAAVRIKTLVDYDPSSCLTSSLASIQRPDGPLPWIGRTRKLIQRDSRSRGGEHETRRIGPFGVAREVPYRDARSRGDRRGSNVLRV
ncbi:hypothetical protein [Streptomyces violascens]|uniref:hypothetical protein n=1 Tax=Streptomyces violascens TaxID=67381 RepID=UPI003685DC9F